MVPHTNTTEDYRDFLRVAGLLANLTCLKAELYQMEKDLSVRENPLWVVPYTTIAEDYQELLDDFAAYAQVLSCKSCIVYAMLWHKRSTVRKAD